MFHVKHYNSKYQFSIIVPRETHLKTSPLAFLCWNLLFHVKQISDTYLPDA